MLNALEAGDQRIMDMEVQHAPGCSVKYQPILNIQITRPRPADDPPCTKCLQVSAESAGVDRVDQQVEIRLTGQSLGKMKIALPMGEAHAILAKGVKNRCTYW